MKSRVERKDRGQAADNLRRDMKRKLLGEGSDHNETRGTQPAKRVAPFVTAAPSANRFEVAGKG